MTRKSVSPSVATLYHGATVPGRAPALRADDPARELPARSRNAGSKACAPRRYLVAASFAKQTCAQRLIAEGAVKIDGASSPIRSDMDTSEPAVLQVGSRKFVRVLPRKLTRWRPRLHAQEASPDPRSPVAVPAFVPYPHDYDVRSAANAAGGTQRRHSTIVEEFRPVSAARTRAPHTLVEPPKSARRRRREHIAALAEFARRFRSAARWIA